MIPCGSNNLACGSIIVANQLNLGMGMILPATDGKTITQFYIIKGRGGSGQAPQPINFWMANLTPTNYISLERKFNSK